jgi:hypothetical protein
MLRTSKRRCRRSSDRAGPRRTSPHETCALAGILAAVDRLGDRVLLVRLLSTFSPAFYEARRRMRDHCADLIYASRLQVDPARPQALWNRGRIVMQIPQDSLRQIGTGEELVARQNERQASSGTLSVLPSRVAFAQRASQCLKRESTQICRRMSCAHPGYDFGSYFLRMSRRAGRERSSAVRIVQSTPSTGTAEVHRGALRICPAAGSEG